MGNPGDDRHDALTRRRKVRRRRIVAVVAGLVVIAVALRLTVLAPVDTHGARVSHITIDSRATGRHLGTTVVVPAGAAGGPRRPLLVFLHGRNGSDTSFDDDGKMFAALARLGRRAPIMAFPDGDDHSYWHKRRAGNWDAYLMKEVIPRVIRDFGADPKRIAVGGISMGGFGALDLALHHPGRFCAVGGHSPALWVTGGETPAGAFDDAEDFDRNDLIGAARTDPASFRAQPVWVDAGDQDPFQPGDHAFVSALRADGVDLSVSLNRPGVHGGSYWDNNWDRYFGFYARAFRHCGR